VTGDDPWTSATNHAPQQADCAAVRLRPILLIATLLLPACTSDDGGSSGTPDTAAEESPPTTEDGTDAGGTSTATTTTDGAAVVGASSAAIVPAAHVPLAAVLKIVLDAPAAIEVTATSGDHVVEVPRTAAVATEHIVPIVGMRADRTYDVTVDAVVDGQPTPIEMPTALTVETPPLPDWLPAHSVTSDPSRVSPGITIIESAPNQGAEGVPSAVAIGYDAEGEVVWYYANGGGLGGIEQTAAGTFLAHYWPFGIREFDALGNVVGHWQPAYVGADGSTSPTDVPPGNDGDAAPISVSAPWVELRSFHHENFPMPGGNILALSTTRHDLTDAQREAICPGDPIVFDAISDVVVEFTPDGSVVRTWDLFDAIDITKVPGTDMCATGGGLFASQEHRDWTHANAVVYDPTRDAILVSSRHTDQIIALDHLDETGPQASVRWIIGANGTIPVDGELTYHQHAVELLDDGGIIVYDNGNFRPGTSPDDPDHPPYSRAVIFDVDDRGDDPSSWTATQRWEHVDHDDDGVPIFTSFIGDADMLANGNVLITHGGIGPFPPTPEFPLRALIVEVDPNAAEGDDIVWRLDSDPAQSHTIYRSERVETFYVGDAWLPRT
jgi:hypothetical protein